MFQSGTGTDTIGDFVRGQDRIDLSSYGMTFAQVQARFYQGGGNGAIQMANGDVIILNNVTMSQLTASDFILAASAEAPKATPVMDDPMLARDKSVPTMDLPASSLPKASAVETDLSGDLYGFESYAGDGPQGWITDIPPQGWLI